jgi:hypothetical protein
LQTNRNEAKAREAVSRDTAHRPTSLSRRTGAAPSGIPFKGGGKISRGITSYWKNKRADDYAKAILAIGQLLKTPLCGDTSLGAPVVREGKLAGPHLDDLFKRCLDARKPIREAIKLRRRGLEPSKTDDAPAAAQAKDCVRNTPQDGDAWRKVPDHKIEPGQVILGLRPDNPWDGEKGYYYDDSEEKISEPCSQDELDYHKVDQELGAWFVRARLNGEVLKERSFDSEEEARNFYESARTKAAGSAITFSVERGAP